MPDSTTRYADPGWRRLALAPGLLAAVALLGGSALLHTEAFTIFRYVVAILALICLVFAFQARHWWWLPVFAAIAVVWNPVLVLEVPDPWWMGLQFAATLAFIVAGVLIKVPVTGDARGR